MSFLSRTWAEIDVSALLHNFNLIKESAKGTKIIAVVKADAYGHGVKIVAPALDKAGADCFAVATLEEALQLRKIKIKKPILILGYTPVSAARILAENNISQCVFSKDYAEELSKAAQKSGVCVKIHLKLDTGMSRLGFDCRSDELSGIGDALASAKKEGLSLEGIFTHFAVSDRNPQSEDGFTDSQYQRFNFAVNFLKEKGLTPKICHCCNSAATLNDPQKLCDGVRPGIILYGLTPDIKFPLGDGFVPVMTLKSTVSMVKEISEGDTVSYGRTFKADKKMRVATIAAGYADGYPRLLSNKGYVTIDGKAAPILGRVCMDQFCVDITHIPNVKMGDEIVLFGKNPKAEDLAEACGTINYEIVCSVSGRVPRIAVNDNE